MQWVSTFVFQFATPRDNAELPLRVRELVSFILKVNFEKLRYRIVKAAGSRHLPIEFLESVHTAQSGSKKSNNFQSVL